MWVPRLHLLKTAGIYSYIIIYSGDRGQTQDSRRLRRS